MNVLVVDNEIDSIVVLSEILQNIHGVENVVSAQSINEAVEVLKTFEPDVTLLDIEMPGGSGFDFLDAIGEHQFKTIFITAHEKYAIEAIRARAFDYLLKPVDFESLNRVFLKLAVSGVLESKKVNMNDKISISTLEEIFFISLRDIIRVSGAGSYSVYHLISGKEIVASHTLKIANTDLPEGAFFRTHGSHVINLYLVDKIDKVDGFEIKMKDNSSVPLSRRRKKEFIQAMHDLPEQVVL